MTSIEKGQVRSQESGDRSQSRAVVLLSGGIDSSTTLAVAKDRGMDCYALTFDYSQRHALEIASAKQVARALGVKRHLIIRFDLSEVGGSALTDRTLEVPKGQEVGEDIPVTYVPARNTIFLSFGLAWAEVLEAPYIFIGANAVDYSGYPDCRPEYLKAFEQMANLATKVSVEGRIRFRIEAPLLYMTKAEIIKLGHRLGLDYGLTWSCYDPQPGGRPCGRCDSCRFRAKGFEEAGLEDPLWKR